MMYAVENADYSYFFTVVIFYLPGKIPASKIFNGGFQ